MDMKLSQNIFKSGIVYIAPQYMDGVGDVTLICTEDDNILVKKNIKTVVENLAKYKFLDLKESRNYYKELLDKGKNIPVVFNEENILFAVKTRIPIGKNDGAMTYVNQKYIEDYDYGIIELETGDTLYTYTSRKTVARNLKDCRFILNDIKIKN